MVLFSDISILNLRGKKLSNMSIYCITFCTGLFFATVVMMIAKKTHSYVLNMGPVNMRHKKRRKAVQKVDKEQNTQLKGPIECKPVSPPKSTRAPKPLAPPKLHAYDRCDLDNLPKHPASERYGLKYPPPTPPPPPPTSPPTPAPPPPPPPPTPRLRVIQVPCNPPQLKEAKSSQCSCASKQFSGFSLKVIPSVPPNRSKPILTPLPPFPCEGCNESKQELRKRRVKDTRHKGCCTEFCPNEKIDVAPNRLRLL